MSKLKPCPFCGGLNIGIQYDGQPAQAYAFCCSDCGGTTNMVPVGGSPSGANIEFNNEKAVELWNRREIEFQDKYNAAQERIRQFDQCIRAVADALNAPACGGVDTDIDDPYGTTDVLVGEIGELKNSLESLRHENHNLNWALGAYGYDKMYTAEEQAESDKAHAGALNRIAKMKKRGDKLVELENRVRVLVDALTRIQDEDIGTAKCVAIAYKALAQTPQQTAEQIERWHIEWMKTLPTFGVWHQGDTEDESDFFLGDTINTEDCKYCIKLVAIPPLPKK